MNLHAKFHGDLIVSSWAKPKRHDFLLITIYFNRQLFWIMWPIVPVFKSSCFKLSENVYFKCWSSFVSLCFICCCLAMELYKNLSPEGHAWPKIYLSSLIFYSYIKLDENWNLMLLIKLNSPGKLIWKFGISLYSFKFCHIRVCLRQFDWCILYTVAL